MSQHIDPEVKQSFIVDNLTTNDAGKALSAAQGKALNDKITTLNSYGKTYHIGWLVSTSTLAQQIQNEFQNHKAESGFRLTFNITSSQAPSDLPSTGQEWKYSCGEVKVRSCDGNGIADGMVILYAFGVNKIALRSFANSNFNANWDVLDNNSKVDKYDYTTSASDENAMKALFDLLPTDKAVSGKVVASSQFFYTAYVYTGSQYGSMIAVLFNGTVKVMGVSGGTKTIRTL